MAIVSPLLDVTLTTAATEELTAVQDRAVDLLQGRIEAGIEMHHL
jgi:hypothetical protein